MRKALSFFILYLALVSGAYALEINGTVPESLKGAVKGEFDLSGLNIKNITYEEGAVILPVTEHKGRTYVDVKLLSKRLYEKIEACFKQGCPKPALKSNDSVSARIKTPVPVVKVEGFRKLRSKVRLANAEVSFDGELLIVLGVMVSSIEPGTFWVAFPAAVEFKSRALKAAAKKAVLSAWGEQKD